MKYTSTITRISIHDEDCNPVYGDSAIHVEVDDEAGGPFIVLRSCLECDDTPGKVSIDFEQWELVDKAARQLMGQAVLAQEES